MIYSDFIFFRWECRIHVEFRLTSCRQLGAPVGTGARQLRASRNWRTNWRAPVPAVDHILLNSKRMVSKLHRNDKHQSSIHLSIKSEVNSPNNLQKNISLEGAPVARQLQLARAPVVRQLQLARHSRPKLDFCIEKHSWWCSNFLWSCHMRLWIITDKRN